MVRFWQREHQPEGGSTHLLRPVRTPPIDRGRSPVYTLYALLLPLLLLYMPAWYWSGSDYVALAIGLALVPVTLIAIGFAVLALRRHERWRWVGLAVLVLNLTVFYTVVRQH